MSLHNYRLLCANAFLFRDGRPCMDCVGTHPWWGVVHRCYRDSTPASVAAAATIAISRATRTWELVERFIAPSEFVKRTFVSAGLPSDRLVVKPHAVADPGHRDRPPSASGTLLYAGKLTPQKGAVTLLDAWQRASASAPRLELVLVGDGPLREELERKAVDRVRFLGWSDPEQVTAMMLAARALVFPSQWYEVFGLVAAEAFAAGLPVVASDIGGPAELVGELGPEWVVTPMDDLDAWTAALARLADDAIVDGAGSHGRELFERNYSPDVGLAALLRVYESILAVGPRQSAAAAALPSAKPG
jgi:glycosyltransferase involved in cell wall biosynthesis